MGRGCASHTPSFLVLDILNELNELAKGLPGIWHDFCKRKLESIFWDSVNETEYSLL